MVSAILGVIALVLAAISLMPNTPEKPTLNISVLLLAIALALPLFLK